MAEVSVDSVEKSDKKASPLIVLGLYVVIFACFWQASVNLQSIQQLDEKMQVLKTKLDGTKTFFDSFDSQK